MERERIVNLFDRRRFIGRAGGIVKKIVTGVTGVVSFITNQAMPTKITCEFLPDQVGTGDPAPTNVRSISGYTGCNVVHTKENIFSGTVFRDALLNTFTNSSASGNDVTYKYAAVDSKKKVFTHFKPNTQYTIITTSSGGNNQTQLAFYYTDGTSSSIAKSGTFSDKGTAVVTSTANKTIEYLGVAASNFIQLVMYCDECGLFEGVVTLDEFKSYNANTLSFDWANDAGTVYGGTLTINEDGSGTLVKSYNSLNLTNISWVNDNNVRFWYTAPIDLKDIVSQSDAIVGYCDNYKVIPYQTLDSNNPHYTLGLRPSGRQIYVVLDGTTTVSPTGLLVYEMKDEYKTTYNLTASQVNSIVGTNNIWYNMKGSITVEYYFKE